MSTISEVWDPWLDTYGEVKKDYNKLAGAMGELLFAIDSAKTIKDVRKVRDGESISNCLAGFEAEFSGKEGMG